MPPKKINTTSQVCGYCSALIQDKTQPSIQCAACRHWFHSKCTDFTPEFKATAISIKRKESLCNCTPCVNDISVETCEDFRKCDDGKLQHNLSPSNKI